MSTPRNSLAELGGQLRKRRQATGLSQVAAAKAARVGRSTLIHLEHGRKDIRLSNVLSIADAIGASIGIAGTAPELDERRRVRAEEALKLARRRNDHLLLALDLALGKRGALRALAEARDMVALWRKERTCSPRYIEEWSRILSGAPRRVAQRIRDMDDSWIDALLQNTPFAGTLART